MKYLLTAGKFTKKDKEKRENEKLYQELWEYSSNIIKTNEFIESYETARELLKTGLILTPLESYKRAQKYSKLLIDCNLIKNGLIVSGVLEVMQDTIKKAALI